MLSTPPEKLRLALLLLGIVLGLSGVWMLLPVLLSPNPIGLSFDRNGAEAAAAHRTRAVLAAEIGAIRGNLWASAAFTGARFMGTEGLTSFDRKELRTTRTSQGQRREGAGSRPDRWRGMALFGHASGRPAGCREPPRHASRNVLFHRSECTGACTLAPQTGGNLKRARGQGHPGIHQKRYSGDFATPAGISTSHHCRLSQRLAAESAYFESLVADVDSAAAQSLHSGQPN